MRKLGMENRKLLVMSYKWLVAYFKTPNPKSEILNKNQYQNSKQK